MFPQARYACILYMESLINAHCGYIYTQFSVCVCNQNKKSVLFENVNHDIKWKTHVYCWFLVDFISYNDKVLLTKFLKGGWGWSYSLIWLGAGLPGREVWGGHLTIFIIICLTGINPHIYELETRITNSMYY